MSQSNPKLEKSIGQLVLSYATHHGTSAISRRIYVRHMLTVLRSKPAKEVKLTALELVALSGMAAGVKLRYFDVFDADAIYSHSEGHIERGINEWGHKATKWLLQHQSASSNLSWLPSPSTHNPLSGYRLLQNTFENLLPFQQSEA